MKKGILILFSIAFHFLNSVYAQSGLNISNSNLSSCTMNTTTMTGCALNNSWINGGTVGTTTLTGCAVNNSTLSNISSATTNNLVVDNGTQCDGTIPTAAGGYALRFGVATSGEGISSTRIPINSPSLNGLNFLTYYQTRFRIYNNGNAAFVNGATDYVTFVPSTGAVGIGTPTPTSILHLQGGNLQLLNSGAQPLLSNTNKYGLTMGFNGGTTKTPTDYSWIQSSNGPIVLNPNSTTSLTTQTNSYVAIGFNPTTADGISTANGYNLVVKGKILCEELKIKLKPTSGPWPDYVFASNYKLMAVDSLQSYINNNCHLPDVPSASEVEENGIMAGEMNAILLKKVEELTLYMIEQNKKNAEQTTSITNQNEQINLLKEQNELLMQQVKLLMQK